LLEIPVAERVRVALCDDHAVVLHGLHRLLEAVGRGRRLAEAVTLADASHPDVFVMDLGLPDPYSTAAWFRVRHGWRCGQWLPR